MPGNLISFLLSSAIRSALVRYAPVHSRYGLRPTKNSALKKPVASVPSSGRPCSDATSVTSGKTVNDVSHLRHQLGRFLERDRRRHRGPDPERAFVEVRHELRADARGQEYRCRENAHARRRSSSRGRAKHQSSALAYRSRIHSNTGLRRSMTPPRRTRAQSTGSSRERQDQRADQRVDHGVGHRREQPPRWTGQHIDREEARDDDRHRVHDRAIDLGRSLGDHLANRERWFRVVAPAFDGCSPPSPRRRRPGCRSRSRRSTAGWPECAERPGR